MGGAEAGIGLMLAPNCTHLFDARTDGWKGDAVGHAMPGHGAHSRVRALEGGGARGWHHRAKVSMMLMRPPQQGQDGR